MGSSAPVQCCYFGKFGHIMARCYARQDAQQRSPTPCGHARDNK